MTMQGRNWSDWDGETFLDNDTGLRVFPDGAVYPWQDTGRGYDIHVGPDGEPDLDPRTGKYTTRTVKTSARPANPMMEGSQPTPAVYDFGEVAPPRRSGGGAGYTTGQQVDDALAREKFGYTKDQDAIEARRQEAQDKIKEAISNRDFAAAEKWAKVDRDLRERQFQLTSQGQAFTQEQAQRNEAIALAERPESYLTSLGLSGQLPGGQNALFDLLGSLGGGWKTPGVEPFSAQAGAQPAAQPLAPESTQPAAAPLATATTGMYPAGYENQNPNAPQQLKEWQAERVQNGQDPNDTEAFRQHLIGIGAPAFDVQSKDGGAVGPAAVSGRVSGITSRESQRYVPRDSPKQPKGYWGRGGAWYAPGDPGYVDPAQPAQAFTPDKTNNWNVPRTQGSSRLSGAPAAGKLSAYGEDWSGLPNNGKPWTPPASATTPVPQPAPSVRPFPTLDEILNLNIGGKALRDTRLGAGATPLGSGAPGSGTRLSGGISPFAVKPVGGMRRVTAGNVAALNPEDALALGQTYRNTGNRALLADMLRKPGTRALVR